MASVPLNICEGSRRVGIDRLFHFRVASGSAAEVSAAVDVASAFGYVQSTATVELLDRVRAMLYRVGATR